MKFYISEDETTLVTETTVARNSYRLTYSKEKLLSVSKLNKDSSTIDDDYTEVDEDYVRKNFYNLYRQIIDNGNVYNSALLTQN